ncbi:MAG: 50S ribosomal protein L10 [Deltaproteobacteria bacterium]|nr:MAG: 50S ribosomal protein L10 [Deltaproteobacteria bacterium]
MNRQQKVKLVSELHEKLKSAKAAFLVDYKGLDVKSMSALRRQLREVNTEMKVVKNRLLKLASKGTNTESIQDAMKGPSAIVISYEDVVAPAKILVNFSKENENLKIKKGQLTGKVLDFEKIKQLAELPSREQLLAQTLSVMMAVPASFVRVLNGVIVKFLNVLKAIEEQKKEG